MESKNIVPWENLIRNIKNVLPFRRLPESNHLGLW